MRDHNYTPIKHVHKTENQLHYRIKSPHKDAKYIIHKFNNYIKATMVVSG